MTREKKRALCDQVLVLTREQLLDLLPQLGSALAALPWKPDTQRGFRLDGLQVCFCLEDLLGLYAKEPERLLRGYLHMLLHCLYLHPFFTEHAGEPLWDAACDLAVERIIDGLNLPKLGKKSPILPELGDTPLTAEEIYGYLQAHAPNLDCSAYVFDNHGLWKEAPGEGRRKWEALLLAASGAKTGAGKRGRTPGANQEAPEETQAGEFDYRHYLERFATVREEMQLDLESFDYAYYCLGLELGTPFLEPLEYQEVRRLEELVIAIDTSGSCDKETVSRFLAETWRLLSQQENFFRKMNVYFLQCDCLIQDVTRITSQEDWMDYTKKIVIQGRGGTDFTPVFDYVETLRQAKDLKNLKALFYFTDGDGFYPTQPPDYETAFVLLKDSGHPELVPKWAKCLFV